MQPNDPTAEALAASEQARASGDHGSGAACAEHALTLALKANDLRSASHARSLLTMHLWRQDELERAFQIGLDALSQVDAVGAPEWAIDLRHTLTMMYLQQGIASDALPHAAEALRRARLLGTPKAVGWSLNRMSVVYDALGDVTRAIELQQQAIETALTQDDVDLRFSTHVNLASILIAEAERRHMAGDADRARALSHQVLVAAATASSLADDQPIRIMYAAGMASDAHEVLGDAKAMHSLVAQHQVMSQRARIPRFDILGELMRARAFMVEGRNDEACQVLESQVNRVPMQGEDITVVSFLETQYKVYKAAGRFDSALMALEQLRQIELRQARQRTESQSRVLLREVEVANARNDAEQLRQQATELEAKAKAATQASLRDPLTGLANRRALDSRLQSWFRPTESRRAAFAAALIDIDHFKRINDTYGHDIGDKVLRELAQLLVACTRDEDTVFRHGGEEFVLLVSANALPPAAEVCERLRRSVEQHDWSKWLPIGEQVTISIGLTTLVEQDDGATLLRRADLAMYRAKREGRNRVAVD